MTQEKSPSGSVFTDRNEIQKQAIPNGSVVLIKIEQRKAIGYIRGAEVITDRETLSLESVEIIGVRS